MTDDNDRTLFRVSCKIALYTPDRAKVLIAGYGVEGFGLPGGHIDTGETPDEAMRRELKEETGITDVEIEHRDFWVHSNGKIVLGYTGVIEETSRVVRQKEEIASLEWVLVDDIAAGKLTAGSSYDEFVTKFAAKT